jgi:thiosulfate/3-mercaptopyruvate sulfurtransferase
MPHDPVIAPAALAAAGPFRLLDARDEASFAAAHAAGAVRVPVEAWVAAAQAAETSLDNVGHWQAAIGALGIGDDDALAVAYDDGRMTEAARVWFILQYFGVRAAILDGGWPALAGLPLPPAAPPGSGFRARPGSGAVGLVDRHALRGELGSGRARVLDARTAAEFAGEDLRANARGGHLPGAAHLAHASLLEAGHLKPAGELRRLLAGAGFRDGDAVVTHCDGGGRAALAAAAALRAGYGDVRAYYLSFADWARDEGCPVVRG